MTTKELIEACKALGVSNRQLAIACNLSTTTMQNIKKGTNSPVMRTHEKINKFYQTLKSKSNGNN